MTNIESRVFFLVFQGHFIYLTHDPLRWLSFFQENLKPAKILIGKKTSRDETKQSSEKGILWTCQSMLASSCGRQVLFWWDHLELHSKTRVIVVPLDRPKKWAVMKHRHGWQVSWMLHTHEFFGDSRSVTKNQDPYAPRSDGMHVTPPKNSKPLCLEQGSDF